MLRIAIFYFFWAFFSYFSNASASMSTCASDTVNELLNDTKVEHFNTKSLYKLGRRLGHVSAKFKLDHHTRFSHPEALQLLGGVQKVSGEHTIYTGGSAKNATDFIHVVPQSFFSPYTSQKVINSDLHNIYASQSINFDSSNSVYKFAAVPDSKADIIYNGSVKGVNDADVAKNISKYGCKVSTKDKKFEPNDEAKGMAARACAYILTRYQWLLPRMNELIDIKTMVEWHEKYPPSEPEKKREAEIFKVQKNHNPYITQSASYMREVWLG
ncbi:MAG: endonuclease [Proteobacteria bacterium]|nr:endonuclease [Pseudomonadota bacterium]